MLVGGRPSHDPKRERKSNRPFSSAVCNLNLLRLNSKTVGCKFGSEVLLFTAYFATCVSA